MKLRMFQSMLSPLNVSGAIRGGDPLQAWLPDELMQAIAAENNLPRRPFRSRGGRAFHIRWFSPLTEIDFCGHATLASAFVLLEQGLARAPLTFRAAAVGDLAVQRRADGLLEMSFPNRAPEPVAEPPAALLQGLGLRRKRCCATARHGSPSTATKAAGARSGARSAGVAHAGTAGCGGDRAGREQDFASRYFWPANGGAEDPVTGSIHAGLAPYWAERLGRNELVALQASARTGILHCRVEADRVMVAGQVVFTSTAPSNSKTNSRAHCVRSVTCAMGVPVCGWSVETRMGL